MPTYDTPGVYIEEQTGPGVIAGVGTSTAAFIGPARNGVMLEPLRISSYDEFLANYAVAINGEVIPYILSPRWFYMALAVRGFFQNGGSQAYIVRVGTAGNATWIVNNQDGKPVFLVQAATEGVAGNNIAVSITAANATGNAGVGMSSGSATAQNVSGVTVTLAAGPNPFKVGDTVAEDLTPQTNDRAQITAIDPGGTILTLSQPIAGLASGEKLRIAHLVPAQDTIRMASTSGLYPGSVVLIHGDDADNPGTTVDDYAVVQSVDAAGFVTFAASPARAHRFNLAAATAPVLISQEFRLAVTPQGGTTETFDNLSLDMIHPNYVFKKVASENVRLLPPDAPPTTNAYPGRLVNAAGPLGAPATAGQPDDPGSITADDYKKGLDALRNVDEVNLVCIPDAAGMPVLADQIDIQKAMIEHCEALKDCFAILDPPSGLLPTGTGSVEQYRENVESAGGYAALYYPWLITRVEIRDPTTKQVTVYMLPVPPSGHMAGIYARTDGERGVHKAPANTDVRGVLGLERRLTDAQQGPLNLKGINVLRIFQGSSTVMVWGARTTVDPNITDWIYVNVRRLMLYLEESIEEGIRWAVFEPNNLALWQKLKRTLNEFLTRVWRDGALFGDSADKAFYVRIDEALNTAATRALGRLYIEIGVAAVRPAEFIIVRIGLWDGGSDVTEG